MRWRKGKGESRQSKEQREKIEMTKKQTDRLQTQKVHELATYQAKARLKVGASDRGRMKAKTTRGQFHCQDFYVGLNPVTEQNLCCLDNLLHWGSESLDQVQGKCLL